jgi:hypothetical protein
LSEGREVRAFSYVSSFSASAESGRFGRFTKTLRSSDSEVATTLAITLRQYPFHLLDPLALRSEQIGEDYSSSR